MITDTTIKVGSRGVTMWVTVSPEIFDEVEAHLEIAHGHYDEEAHMKVIEANNVTVVFTKGAR